MAKLITVRGKLESGRVVLWERDSDHPNGEAFVAGTDTAEVADTAGVRSAIAEGKLERVEESPESKSEAKKPAESKSEAKK